MEVEQEKDFDGMLPCSRESCTPDVLAINNAEMRLWENPAWATIDMGRHVILEVIGSLRAAATVICARMSRLLEAMLS